MSRTARLGVILVLAAVAAWAVPGLIGVLVEPVLLDRGWDGSPAADIATALALVLFLLSILIMLLGLLALLLSGALSLVWWACGRIGKNQVSGNFGLGVLEPVGKSR